MATITFLGTGLNGAGFAEAAAKRGDRVRVWNRTASKAKALEALGVRAESTVAEAVAGAERVHVVLSDDAVVDSVLDAAGETARSSGHRVLARSGVHDAMERLARRAFSQDSRRG